jgi:hypothetical protein
VHLPFYRAGIYLWLNFHTIHHLFPRLDFSHHPAAQRILLDTCQVAHPAPRLGLDLGPWPRLVPAARILLHACSREELGCMRVAGRG